MNPYAWSQAFDNEIHGSRVPGIWNLRVDGNLLKTDYAEYFKQSTYGSFHCSRCRHSWSSSKVLILFRMDLNGYGEVAMRIFRQECKICSTMLQPKIQNENIKRAISNVVSRIQKVFYGKQNANDKRPPKSFGEQDGPHDEDHCEACQHGLCQRQTTSSQESSSGVGTAIATGVGITAGIIGIGALALLAVASLNKTKESKRGAP